MNKKSILVLAGILGAGIVLIASSKSKEKEIEDQKETIKYLEKQQNELQEKLMSLDFATEDGAYKGEKIQRELQEKITQKNKAIDKLKELQK